MRAALPVGFAALWLAVASGQTQESLAQFRTEANYIRVDIYPMLGNERVNDLRLEEIELLDEGVPQKIEKFEHIRIQGQRSQQVRREPTTVAEMRAAALDVRARLFVLFLDTLHVDGNSSNNISKSLIDTLNATIGEDDLIAVMKPGMEVRDLTFTRRTGNIEDLLRTRWGTRDEMIVIGDNAYATCYPSLTSAGVSSDNRIAQEMILRRREVRTFDALEELIRHLGGLREERKAVITISNGWRLYEDDETLRRGLHNPKGDTNPIDVDSRTGKLSTGVTRVDLGVATPECEQARIELSMLDHPQRFRNILNAANRANASFYTIDPRIVAVFDEDIVPVAGVGNSSRANPSVDLVEDAKRLNARNTSLRTLAENTDGLAVVQTGDIAKSMQRIVDDLSSYYLLGYYSTQKLDGKFHAISVRIKRPGVQVRARRGYLAFNAAAPSRISTGAKPAPLPEASRMEAPLATLSALTRERPMRLHAAAGWNGGTASIWVVAEVPQTTGRHDWSAGGQLDATLSNATGAHLATEQIAIPAGASSLKVTFKPSPPLTAGEYQVSVRARGTGQALASSETVRISLNAAPTATGVVFLRRGITTGNKEVPTADQRFRRTERAIIEIPTSIAEAGTGRLLDRTGRPLVVPVTTTTRQDPDGSTWRIAQIVLAPLAAGDYIIETTAGNEQTLTAIRVLQ